MIKTPEFDFEKSIEEKIAGLEEEKEEKERYLEYAKIIKVTGKFPLMPKEIGFAGVKFYKNIFIEMENEE